MKLSRFSELNDPFELTPHALRTPEDRAANKILRELFSEKRGVICFSTDWHNPVMWAHYGDKHYDMCLGFDVPDTLALKVSYKPTRLKFDVELSALNAGLNIKKIEAMLLTKLEARRYEKERRVMADLQDKDAMTGLYFTDFGEQLMLREVIIGVRCETSQ
jgi:hypothetical protein